MCVRLDTYESKETQDRIRDLLDGSMQNTAFVIYAPDGKTKLTRSGRAPELVFGRGRLASRNGSSNEEVIKGMEKIAAKYEMKGDLTQAELQDFDSFKQSLNIASSDQKLLVFTVSPRAKLPAVEKVLTEVANDAEVHGRFHFDTAGKPDVKWAEKVTKEKNKTGVFVIRSGQFGQEGYVMTEFPLDVTVESLKAGLLAANETFAKLEERKHYGDHVSDGRRKGIKFDSNVEAGEDRDGDGKIDEQKRRGKRGERGERRGPPRGRRGPPPEHEDGPTSDLMDFLDL